LLIIPMPGGRGGVFAPGEYGGGGGGGMGREGRDYIVIRSDRQTGKNGFESFGNRCWIFVVPLFRLKLALHI